MPLKPPRLTPRTFLFGLLGLLALGSIWSNVESLRFCERALYGEIRGLEQQKMFKAPVKFTDICPEHRLRAETNLNKWLEVILALLVQTHDHPPGP